MYIYLNGKVIPQEEAFISVFDHGFMYGLGVFETFRIYEEHPFLLDDHLHRLNSSLQELYIEKTFRREEGKQIIATLLKANSLTNAYVRWNVSAGNGMVGLQTERYQAPNVIVYMKPIPKTSGMVEKTGQVVTLPRNTPEGTQRLKSHHYLNNILAKREVGDDISIEGIFLTKEGFVAEGITSNIFWIKKGVLYTPSLQTGILNGITRQFVLTLATKVGLGIREGFFSQEEMESADEVFVTNSIQEIVPIKTINNSIFQGIDGTYTKKIHEEYVRYTPNLWSYKELGGI
ncbi:aminodeoxychorismate lyase [Bacillus sp. B1-b2]|uniref:aminodeoxychorismate lyase n=1 Tax=Bacillus sp. B1-b2 TaxID=2653201 RepID=UPI001261DEE2|nr:aminodeoxychorismate lyase [Bacillus sp. B1-b2]KAB7663145.1 aminodeoxychorismate lyase [Bacillus sp. B1-b2]